MKLRPKGCLLLACLLLAVVAALVTIGWMSIPPRVRAGVELRQVARVAPQVVGMLLTPTREPGTQEPAAPGSGTPGKSSDGVSGVAEAGAAAENGPDAREPGTVRYAIPDAAWRPEVTVLFPVEQQIASGIKLRLSNPQFVSDPDGRWLRFQSDLLVKVGLTGGTESFPGQIVVRTQLDYDPASRSVVLANAQLANFSLSGEAAPYADQIRPVLALALPDELNGYQVVRLPRNAGGLVERGLSLVRDVVVENGRVTVVLGRPR